MLKQTIKPILAAMVLMGSAAFGESAPTVASPAQPAAAVNQEALTEAYEMLEIMGMDKTYMKTIDKMLAAQEKMIHPALRNDREKMDKYNRIMREFMLKYVGWDKIRDDIARLYVRHYTAEEIRDIKKFYLTPVGQKTLRIMPQIAADTVRLTNDRILPHAQELQGKITELLKANTPKAAH